MEDFLNYLIQKEREFLINKLDEVILKNKGINDEIKEKISYIYMLLSDGEVKH